MLRKLRRRILWDPLRRWRRRWAPAGLALALFPLVLAACGSREGIVRAENPPPNPAATVPATVAVTAGDLLQSTAQYDGKTVSVAGEVNTLVGSKGFTLGGEEFVPPGELLVICPNGFPPVPARTTGGPLAKDDVVQVTGTLRTFTGAEMGSMLGENADADHYGRWEGKPVLVATQLVTTPRAAGAAGSDTPLTDLNAILTPAAREALIGHRVNLTGVKVESVVADRAFWIGGPSTQRLFVAVNDEVAPGVPVETRADVHPAQKVTLSGVLERAPFPEDARRRWGLSSEEAAPLAEEGLYLAAESIQLDQQK